VICISHDTGAGGHQVGAALATRLGFRLVDEEIVVRAAEARNLTPDDVANAERRKSLLERIITEMGRSAGVEGAYMYATIPLEAVQDPGSIRDGIRQAIHETAAAGNVVIVSHAASYALAGNPNVLRVLVTASDATRTSRLQAALGGDTKKAAKELAANDAGRAAYLKRFYGVTAELPTHYDVVVNTDVLSTDEVAGVIAAAC
jgi:cytidylate kinase